jgi:hypothetical protein
LDNVGLVSLEGVEVASSSNFEFGDFRVLFNENSYIAMEVLFFAGFFDLSADLPSFKRLKNSLGFLISLG